MKEVSGGVCAALGFKANGVHCGIRKNRQKRDLALIYSETKASAASVYTQNLVKGAPLTVTKANLADGYAQAIICNSGNANTCCAGGVELAEETCALAAGALGLEASDIVVASTGVIGEKMSIEPFKRGIAPLVEGLDFGNSALAEEAILTTDTIHKAHAVSFEIGGVTCTLGGIAKGSGMIHPNMATMLCFITTDTAISPAMLQKALSEDVVDSFNMVTVDGDTSTNDMMTILANGRAGNAEISAEGADFDIFKAALAQVSRALSRMIAMDGEGATKLITCKVQGAQSKKDASAVAKAIVGSSLVKAAMFGADANWGRILCAAGYCGAPIDPERFDVGFSSEGGQVTVCVDGCGVPFSEELAKKVLSEKCVDIEVDVKSGSATATAWGCDLTYDYVKINGDYRT